MFFNAYKIGLACDAGVKRSDRPNQDAIGAVVPNLFKLNFHPPLLIVADGMGGYHGGALASSLVVRTIQREYRRARLKGNPLALLQSCVLAAHQAVRARATGDEELGSMGSTVVAVILAEKKLHLINVGDSRAYLINPKGIRQVSYDHSRVAELVREGVLSAAEAHGHPDLNRLTMSVSGQRDQVLPFTASIALDPKDVVLLCSDGLWGTLSESQLWGIACELAPRAAVKKLVEMAKAAGGPDNISVIIARRRDNRPQPLEETEIV